MTGLALLAAAALCACERPPVAEVRPQRPVAESGCGENGRLTATLTGGIEAEVDWPRGELSCENMLRPNGEGARLRFSGRVAGERLVIIIAMPDLGAEQTGAELPSNVTATVEGSGRFFSTPDFSACWTEIRSQKPLAENEDRYAIAGTLYCITPLGELNGNSAVSIPQLSFTSIVDWSTT